MIYKLTQKEVWDRFRKRPYLISYLQHHKILFGAIEALRKNPTTYFYRDVIEKDNYIDRLFRNTWTFDKYPELQGWKLMREWPKYYASKNEL